MTVSYLQSLLVAKLDAPTLIGNKLQSLLITNLSFTSIFNLYSIEGKPDDLKPLLKISFKFCFGLVLPLWLLTLCLYVLPWTTLVAPPLLLLPHSLQP